MEMSDAAREARGGARRVRASILAQVLLASALALCAVLLVTWISERRGFRWRVDLTSDGENTLAPVSMAVIEQLPETVYVDEFFRALEPPMHVAGAIAQDRTRRLLRRASDESGGRIVLAVHDLTDPGRLPARTLARMSELKLTTIEPGGFLVVSCGKRREIVRLRPDLADIDPGQSDPRRGEFVPARIVNFRGEEALMSALLKVSQGETRKIVFTQGHGEPDVKSGDPLGLASLVTELESDGFDVSTWEAGRQGAMPSECDLLAIIGPEQVFTEAEIADIKRFVESGGRLIAAPGRRAIDGPGSLGGLLPSFGVRMNMIGLVARPVPSAAGVLQAGIPECGILAIGSEGMPAMNPVTEPLRRAEMRVTLLNSRVLERGDVPPGGRVLDLLFVPDSAWHEMPIPPSDDRYDWQYSESEATGRFSVAMQAAFPPRREVLPRFAATSSTRPECRAIVVGSREAFLNRLVESNRDFLLNAFNWLGSREYRVKVSKDNPEARRIDVNNAGSLSRVTWIAMGLLPIACAIVGFLTVWRRNRR